MSQSWDFVLVRSSLASVLHEERSGVSALVPTV